MVVIIDDKKQIWNSYHDQVIKIIEFFHFIDVNNDKALACDDINSFFQIHNVNDIYLHFLSILLQNI